MGRKMNGCEYRLIDDRCIHTHIEGGKMDGCIDCGEMYRQQVNIYTDGRDMVYG